MLLHKPRKAVGEIFPFLMDTIMVIPVSKNGIEKSTTSLRLGVIFSEVNTISALWSWICLIRPFHSPVPWIRRINSNWHISSSLIFSIKHLVMNYADHLWIVSDSGIFKQVLDTFFISFEKNYTILLKAVTFFCFTMLMSNNRRERQLLISNSWKPTRAFTKCFPRIK